MRGLQFGISILLARLLVPEQFGLVAMLSVFTGFAQTLVDGGFGSALIQAKQPTEVQRCSIFYFNILISFLLAVALCIAAPWIAGFYHQPKLINILRALSFLPLINGLGLVQNVLLVRQLDVKKQTLILVAGTTVSGTVAVLMAFSGFGVWSLVAQQLTQSLVRAVLLWCSSNWRPVAGFSFQALGEMFRFGWGMLCSSILASAYDNLYPLLIGKFFSAASLGYFNRAQSLQTVASQSLGAIANRVTFPVFSAMQDDLVRFRSGLKKAMTTITFIQFPMMIGLAVVAKPLVLLVLTDKWENSIPYLQILAIAGMMYPLHVLNLNVLTSLGRSDLFFRLEVFKVAIFLATGLLTFRFGVLALLWGQLFCDVAGYFVNSYYTKRLIDYSVWKQLQDVCPCLVAAIVMGLLDSIVSSYLPSGNLFQLCFRVSFGALLYFLICFSMRLPAMGELASVVWRRSANAPDTVA